MDEMQKQDGSVWSDAEIDALIGSTRRKETLDGQIQPRRVVAAERCPRDPLHRLHVHYADDAVVS